MTTKPNELADDVSKAVCEAHQAAAKATADFLVTQGGVDACGFAWIKTKVKGNTKLGRALLKNGFKTSYPSGLAYWNPSGNTTQCITAKEEGAIVAARILTEKLGADFYAESRMD